MTVRSTSSSLTILGMRLCQSYWFYSNLHRQSVKIWQCSDYFNSYIFKITIFFTQNLPQMYDVRKLWA